jgi:transposase
MARHLAAAVLDRRRRRTCSVSASANLYLRKILIHDARAAILRIERDRAPIGPWLDWLDAVAHKNVVVVARPTS